MNLMYGIFPSPLGDILIARSTQGVICLDNSPHEALSYSHP